MATTKVGEPKIVPGASWMSRRVTRDRKFYGELRSYKRGILASDKPLVVYWAVRRTDEFFHADQSWAVDVDTVNAIKAYGAQFIGIEVEDGTKLLAPIGLFSHTPEAKAAGVVVRNYAAHKGAKGKLGALQYYVPEKLFAIKRPPLEEREEALIERMHISKK